MKTISGLIAVMMLGFIFCISVMGQNNREEEVYYELDQKPKYPGGVEKLKEFIAKNISYSEEAKKEGIQGKVFVSFTIDKKGDVVKTEIAKGVHPLLDKEAMRVVESMPSWSPGWKDGHEVNVRFTVPVQFKLNSEQEKL